MEDYSRGLRGRVGNAVGVLKRAWVRIPCLPSINKTIGIIFFYTSIKKNAEISAFFISINGAGGSRTHVQTPANIFVYNHRLCIVLTAPRHITQA